MCLHDDALVSVLIMSKLISRFTFNTVHCLIFLNRPFLNSAQNLKKGISCCTKHLMDN